MAAAAACGKKPWDGAGAVGEPGMNSPRGIRFDKEKEKKAPKRMKDDSRIHCLNIYIFCCNILGAARDRYFCFHRRRRDVRFVFPTAVGPYQTERKSPGRLLDEDDANELNTTIPSP